MIRIKGPREFCFALSLIAFSLACWYLVADLRMGTAMRMGPGYVPVALSLVGLVLGGLIGLRSVTVAGQPVGAVAWRPVLAITAAVASFVAINVIGLAVAALAVTLVACLGDRDTRWGQALALALALAVFTVLVFVKGLGLPMPIWPAFIVS